MHIGDPCPCCGKPLTLRKWPGPRQGGRASFAYCAHDHAAWELTPEEPTPLVATAARGAAISAAWRTAR